MCVQEMRAKRLQYLLRPSTNSTNTVSARKKKNLVGLSASMDQSTNLNVSVFPLTVLHRCPALVRTHMYVIYSYKWRSVPRLVWVACERDASGHRYVTYIYIRRLAWWLVCTSMHRGTDTIHTHTHIYMDLFYIGAPMKIWHVF